MEVASLIVLVHLASRDGCLWSVCRNIILLLVYRMRKKDEGSYDLGERKPSSAAYQKAPTKEFYA